MRTLWRRNWLKAGRAHVVEASKRRLHRVWAAYLGEPDYDRARTTLDTAFAMGRDDVVRAACAEIMNVHASSRERLPILQEFFSRIFSITGQPGRIVDLACALNPLAFRWMGLPADAHYAAYDINTRTIDLVSHYFRLEGLAPLAEVRDVLCSPPTQQADVAYLLKMYHCLEHRRKGAGWQVVQGAPASWVVVSFPTRNLAGKAADIAGNYDTQIRTHAASCGWTCERLDFASEVALLVGKR